MRGIGMKAPWLAIAALALLPAVANAQLWELRPDVSFGYSSAIGWAPVDAAVAGSGYFNARTGGYVKAGYGLALDMDYYFLLPELESAAWVYGGMDMLGGASTDFWPGGAAEAGGAYRDYTRAYLDIGLEQILLGDRRHERSYLMLGLGDVSRYVMPGPVAGGTLQEPFFTHAPYARLDFNLGSTKPFWDVLCLSGGAGATLEAGHSSLRGAWAFIMSEASLGFKLPLVGKYLYLDAKAALEALLGNLVYTAPVPAWSYMDYPANVTASAGLDLKSRIVEFDPLMPMAVELGLGMAGSMEAGDVSALYPPAMEFAPRAFVDLACDFSILGSFRVRFSVNYLSATGSLVFGFGMEN